MSVWVYTYNSAVVRFPRVYSTMARSPCKHGSGNSHAQVETYCQHLTPPQPKPPTKLLLPPHNAVSVGTVSGSGTAPTLYALLHNQTA